MDTHHAGPNADLCAPHRHGKEYTRHALPHSLINLTDHDIHLYDGDLHLGSIPPSGFIARVITRRQLIGYAAGVPTYQTGNSVVANLPNPQPHVLYIVSRWVYAMQQDRCDLIAPLDVLRDEQHQAAGCRGFASRLKGEEP